MFLCSLVLLLIFVVHAFSAIPFSYLWSLVAKTPSGGFAFLTTIHIVTGKSHRPTARSFFSFSEFMYRLDFTLHNIV